MSGAGQLSFDQGCDAFKRSVPHIAAAVQSDFTAATGDGKWEEPRDYERLLNRPR